MSNTNEESARPHPATEAGEAERWQYRKRGSDVWADGAKNLVDALRSDPEFEVRGLYAHPPAAAARIAELEAAFESLKDPQTLATNIMRGVVAKLDERTLLWLLGDKWQQMPERIAALESQLAEREEGAREIVAAYDAGFRRACDWARRDDMLHDLESFAYTQDRAFDLERLDMAWADNKPVAQGGGVDAEKVMALVEEYGDLRYRLACVGERSHVMLAIGAEGKKDEIRALLSAPPAASGWQPIETAPKDGRMALVYRPLAHLSNDETVAIKRLVGGNNTCWNCTVPDGQYPCNP
ncbi:MAG TPA: hypothetical protein VFM34_11255, partial [Moraxellaceae bacterium]|nr:hypothetical protein [Moraxellaceae bacterium]